MKMNPSSQSLLFIGVFLSSLSLSSANPPIVANLQAGWDASTLGQGTTSVTQWRSSYGSTYTLQPTQWQTTTSPTHSDTDRMCLGSVQFDSTSSLYLSAPSPGLTSSGFTMYIVAEREVNGAGYLMARNSFGFHSDASGFLNFRVGGASATVSDTVTDGARLWTVSAQSFFDIDSFQYYHVLKGSTNGDWISWYPRGGYGSINSIGTSSAMVLGAVVFQGGSSQPAFQGKVYEILMYSVLHT